MKKKDSPHELWSCTYRFKQLVTAETRSLHVATFFPPNTPLQDIADSLADIAFQGLEGDYEMLPDTDFPKYVSTPSDILTTFNPN